MMKITFIGFGNMAKAIAMGLLKNNNLELFACSPSLSIGINELGIRTHHDNLVFLPQSDVVILAVKPAEMQTVLDQISPHLSTHTLLISVAAGLKLSWYSKKLPKNPMVRAMPNLAASYDKSATPLIANDFLTKDQKDWTEQIFTNIGVIAWVENEKDMDAFTALSGSGPAYVFLFIEAMIKSAVALGIKEDLAKSFALQTVEGALSLARESNLNLNELRKKITSPGGTTEAAIEVFTKLDFEEMIHSAMKAAYDRAQHHDNEEL